MMLLSILRANGYLRGHLSAAPAIVVGAAAVVAAFTGFGFNLVAAPLLLLIYEPKDVVPITLLLGVLTSSLAAGAAGRRGEINFPLLGLLMLGSLPGLLVGTSAFAVLNPEALRLIIGVVTALSALLLIALSRGGRIFTPRPAGSAGAGFLSGILVGMTGTGGPPIAAYVTLTTPEAGRVRGTVIGHVTLVSLAALGALALHHQLTHGQLTKALALAPSVVIGLLIGSYGFRHSSTRMYRWMVSSSLCLSAVAGIIVAAR
jgi:uncharacterized membrane protein YfcA